MNKVYILDKDHIGRYRWRTMATKEFLNVRDTARAWACTRTRSATGKSAASCAQCVSPAAASGASQPQDVERLRDEMFEQLAPATEGPVVNPGRKRSGRLVFGDATE